MKTKEKSDHQKRIDRVRISHQYRALEAPRDGSVMAQVRAHEIIGQIIAYCESKLKAEVGVSAPLLSGVKDKDKLIRAYRVAKLVYISILHVHGDHGLELEVEFSIGCDVTYNLFFKIQRHGHISRVKTNWFPRW